MHKAKVTYKKVLHSGVCLEPGVPVLQSIAAEGGCLPKVVIPIPALSNKRKATMKRASGAHSTDSNARNSWKEINLGGDRGI